MATKPKRPCNRVGCRNLTTQRFCEEHVQAYRSQQDRERGTAHERGYTSRWRKARSTFLKRNPLCACDDCKKLPVPLPAEVVDHIVPHRGDMDLFWDKDNWQPMAKQCHDRKTAREDGGFGRG